MRWGLLVLLVGQLAFACASDAEEKVKENQEASDQSDQQAKKPEEDPALVAQRREEAKAYLNRTFKLLSIDDSVRQVANREHPASEIEDVLLQPSDNDVFLLVPDTQVVLTVVFKMKGSIVGIRTFEVAVNVVGHSEGDSYLKMKFVIEKVELESDKQTRGVWETFGKAATDIATKAATNMLFW